VDCITNTSGVRREPIGRINGRHTPSQAWRTFLKNHAEHLIALDFFTVSTATFRVLFVLVVPTHSRRRLVHFNVTEHPTAEWTARQLLQACGQEGAPRYLIRDRDRVYGGRFLRDIGHPGGGYCASLTVAKRVRRARDRFDSTGMP
jgi:hypothetical protein